MHPGYKAAGKFGESFAKISKVRPGFRAKHNYASRPGRKGGGSFPRSETAEPGSRKTAMRFIRDRLEDL